MGEKGKKPDEGHVSGQSNKVLTRPAHALTYDQVIEELGGNVLDGLKPDEAKRRIEEFGKNDLGEGEGVQPIRIVVAQVANAMTMVLILAMAVSYGIGSYIEGGVVTAVILLNVIVGFFQEYSAEKTMDSLRSLSSPTANVVREGDAQVVPSGEIVPGDLIEMKTGDTIPADVRYDLIDNILFPPIPQISTNAPPPLPGVPCHLVPPPPIHFDLRPKLRFQSTRPTTSYRWPILRSYTELGLGAGSDRMSVGGQRRRFSLATGSCQLVPMWKLDAAPPSDASRASDSGGLVLGARDSACGRSALPAWIGISRGHTHLKPTSLTQLIEAVNFETDEALLTGESLPVRKNEDTTFENNTGPGDRLNVAYSSSTVTKGRARGIVFATGVYTEIGAIASELRKKDSKVRPVKRKPDGTAKAHRYLEAYTLTFTDALGRFLGVNVGTPLQKKLSKLAILLFGIAVVCAIIVLGANKFDSRQEVVIYAVATGLSMIPASLVVVLTITMAAGTKRMVQRNVIVRNLKSLEALGAVTDICSDKTGTLTQGKMVARAAWIPGKGTYTLENSNEPMNPTIGDLRCDARQPRHLNFKKGGDEVGVISLAEKLVEQSSAGLQHFLRVGSLANLATVHKKDDVWHARGDPTEIAIQVFVSRFDWNRLKLVGEPQQGHYGAWREIAELPFDSDVKRMSTIFEEHATGKKFVFTKGAVERVIGACSTYCAGDSDESTDMTDDFREEILRNMEVFAGLGLRVLALASKDFNSDIKKGDEVNRGEVESDLVFRGIIGLYDPPRPESAPAVRQCHEAGISVHMLTGDHPETAKAIAIEVGILPTRMERVAADVAKSMVMTATQFDALSDDEVDKLPVLPLVIARCAPSTKVRMIDALHRRKKFAAMTGDGVNDSPSLKRADVGIAMGQSGSDVAKDASDIVLTDDNFASIVAAIEEGRRIFDNIQKFVLHVLAENIAQAGTLLVGLAFKDSRQLSVFPLAPVEIVWIIMVTSGMPDMGLGFERAVPDILRRPPQSLKTGIFTKEFLVDMVVYGLWIACLCLSAFSLVVFGFGNGSLGEGCNDSYSDSCDTVFRARATTFACLTWFALFLAWEMIDMRRSFFRMQPGSKLYLTQWMHDVWRNKFLFWAIMIGFVTLFPTLYIPVINHKVFKHTGISWEWAIVFIAAFLFFAGVECWKFGKRVFFRRRDSRAKGAAWKDLDIEQRVFGEYLTHDSDRPSDEESQVTNEKVSRE